MRNDQVVQVLMSVMNGNERQFHLTRPMLVQRAFVFRKIGEKG